MIPSIGAVIMRLKSPGTSHRDVVLHALAPWQICHRTMAISLGHHLKTDGCVTWLEDDPMWQICHDEFLCRISTWESTRGDKGEILSAQKNL